MGHFKRVARASGLPAKIAIVSFSGPVMPGDWSYTLDVRNELRAISNLKGSIGILRNC